MKILHLDKNHPLLIQQLNALGFTNEEDYTSSKEDIEQKISEYEGLILRSRFPIDKGFLNKATQLKFIGRVGAGLENINLDVAAQKGIKLFNAPEGNRDAVAEHTLGLFLSLMNRFFISNEEINSGIWLREENRGEEIMGKTIGIIGYGYMGKAFAKRLKGFGCRTICYDIKEDVGDENATQVSLEDFFLQTQLLSLHVPLTPITNQMLTTSFLNKFKNNLWLVNTSRGQVIKTADLVKALQSGKVKGAGLDVLEYEKTSFENLFEDEAKMPEAFRKLIAMKHIILTPHVGGWTHESKEKLAQTIVDKIKSQFRIENKL